MKYFVFAFIVAVSAGACEGTNNKPAQKQAAESSLPAPSRHSAEFNGSFNKLLSAYYDLKDALVEADTSKANDASKQIAEYAGSLPLNKSGNSSSGAVPETAKNYSDTVAGSARGLVRERDIQKKRKQFQVMSDALYDLARTVKYDEATIYHERCPMAINDETEAYWLSNSSVIVNPYLGKKHPKFKDKMVGCGEVVDSLGSAR